MFKKLVSLLIAGFLVCPSAFACDKTVTYLLKDKPAPCTGYLFSPDKELEVRKKFQYLKLLEQRESIFNKKVELYKAQSELLQEIADKEAKKAELWRNRAEDSTEKLITSESGRGTRDWIFLISGVVLTVAAGYAIGQAAK